MTCDISNVKNKIASDITIIDAVLEKMPATQMLVRMQGIVRTLRYCLDNQYLLDIKAPFGIELFVDTREWRLWEKEQLESTTGVENILRQQGKIVAIDRLIFYLVKEGCLSVGTHDTFYKHTWKNQQNWETQRITSWENDALQEDFEQFEDMDDTEAELQGLSSADAAGDYAPDEDEDE